MPTQVRVSGIIIESDEVIVQPAGPAVQARSRGGLRNDAPRREDAVLISALRAIDVELADAIPIAVKTSAAVPAGTRAGPHEPLRAMARVKVPLQADEQAVVLLEDQSEYRWILASGVSEPVGASRSRGARRPASTAARQAEFDLEVSAAAEVAPTPGSRSRAVIGGKLVKGAIAYVLRFVVKAGAELLIRRLEKSITEGLVQIGSTDPATWKPVQAGDVVIRSTNRQPRVLLLVHGTFSSTAGGFGALAGTAEGRAFLSRALAGYDAVLGFDHKTLSLEPEANAAKIFEALHSVHWSSPPRIDIVAHSRGGLVTRELIERKLPGSGWDVTIGPVVFVGCTNGGTQLANADHWKEFADHYTNLALGALRLGGLALDAAPWTVVARGAIQGVGILVKALAVGALEQGGIPGLAAMQPDGAVVKRINSANDGQITAKDAQWYAVTSNFEPKFALELTPPSELPRKLLNALLVRFVDAATDSLYGEDNDLVVHVRAMTQVDAGSEAFFRDQLAFGANGKVYHTNYFTRSEVADKLGKWLIGNDRASAPPGRGRGAPAARQPDSTVAPAVTRAAQEEVAMAAEQIDALLSQRAEPAAPTGAPARERAKVDSPRPAATRARSKAKAKSRAPGARNPKSKTKRTTASKGSRLGGVRKGKARSVKRPGASRKTR